MRVFRQLVFALRRRVVNLRFSGVEMGNNVCFSAGVQIKCSSGGKILIGDNVHVGRNSTIGCKGGVLTIDDDVHFSHGLTLACRDEISIGKNVLVGEYVTIRDQDHARECPTSNPGRKKFSTAPIVIGERAWIGAKCSVLRGASIGDDTVLGANSVARGNLLARSLYAGTPAVLKKSFP